MSAATDEGAAVVFLELQERLDDVLGGFGDGEVGGVEVDFRGVRWLVGGGDAGEALDLAGPRTFVEALGVAGFADFEGGVDEDLDEVAGVDAAAHEVAVGSEGGDEGGGEGEEGEGAEEEEKERRG